MSIVSNQSLDRQNTNSPSKYSSLNNPQIQKSISNQISTNNPLKNSNFDLPKTLSVEELEIFEHKHPSNQSLISQTNNKLNNQEISISDQLETKKSDLQHSINKEKIRVSEIQKIDSSLNQYKALIESKSKIIQEEQIHKASIENKSKIIQDEQPRKSSPDNCKIGSPKLEISPTKKSAPMKSEKPQKPHWETLYDLSKIKTETRQLVLKEKARQDEKYLIECTFKPNIYGESKILSERNPLEVYKRNDDWQQKKELKKQALQEVKLEKDLAHCTFKPVVNKNAETLSKGKDFNLTNQLGVEKYLERQQLARLEKDRVDKITVSGKVKDKNEADKSYTAKFNKNKIKEEEDILISLRQLNFGQGAILLHNFLHASEIKF